MAHIAERMTSHYQQAVLGYEVTTCPDLNQIAAYLREVHPNVLFGVPRVWEKIYAGVNAALAARPGPEGQVRRWRRGRDPDRREEGMGHRDAGGARDVGLPRRRRVQHGARARRPRRARARGHRRGADPARAPRLVPRHRRAAGRGLRHVRELGPDDVHDRQGQGRHGRPGDPRLRGRDRRRRRGHLPRRQRVPGLPQPAREDRRSARSTAGCTPATSARSTTTATSRSSIARRS